MGRVGVRYEPADEQRVSGALGAAPKDRQRTRGTPLEARPQQRVESLLPGPSQLSEFDVAPIPGGDIAVRTGHAHL